MYNELLNGNIIVDITNLVNNVDDNDVDEYCIFMKNIILNTSGNN